ncbi:MAG: hypothetical protein GC180_05510 [Bacteroidetes bacterium]|nr:hypothetical protein [Bacteroidota bacterium]
MRNSTVKILLLFFSLFILSEYTYSQDQNDRKLSFELSYGRYKNLASKSSNDFASYSYKPGNNLNLTAYFWTIRKNLKFGVDIGKMNFGTTAHPHFILNNPDKETVYPNYSITFLQKLYSIQGKLKYSQPLNSHWFLESSLALGILIQRKPYVSAEATEIIQPNFWVKTPELSGNVNLEKTHRISALSTLDIGIGRKIGKTLALSAGFRYMQMIPLQKNSFLMPIHETLLYNDQTYTYRFNSELSAASAYIKLGFSVPSTKGKPRSQRIAEFSNSAIRYSKKVSILRKQQNILDYPLAYQGIFSYLIQIKKSSFYFGQAAGIQTCSMTIHPDFADNNPDKESVPAVALKTRQNTFFYVPEIVWRPHLGKKLRLNLGAGTGMLWTSVPKFSYTANYPSNNPLGSDLQVSATLISKYRYGNYTRAFAGLDYQIKPQHYIGITAAYSYSLKSWKHPSSDLVPVDLMVELNGEKYVYQLINRFTSISFGLSYKYEF